MTNFNPSAGPNSLTPEVLLGESSAAQRLRLRVARIAPHFRIGLITGEPGTGKQTIARHLHRLSPAAGRDFSAFPVPAFLKSNAALHACGLVYLTAIEELDRAAQQQFLRLLRGVQGRTRILVSTSADLKGMVATGRLLPKLFHAVSTLELRIPPLRDRLEDLEPITRSMLTRRSSSASLAPETLRAMRERPWSGNLRELDTLCRQLAPLAGTIGVYDLPHLQSTGDRNSAPPARLEDVLRRHVLDVLESCSGNKLRAAELLGISRSTLYRMLEAQPAATL